jgi:hypothetical protein
MWGLRYRFAEPPLELARFARKGKTLSGTGSGRILIRAARGCHLRERLPFSRRLSGRCVR